MRFTQISWAPPLKPGNPDNAGVTTTPLASLQPGRRYDVCASWSADDLTLELDVSGRVMVRGGDVVTKSDASSTTTTNVYVGKSVHVNAYFSGEIKHVRILTESIAKMQTNFSGQCDGIGRVHFCGGGLYGSQYSGLLEDVRWYEVRFVLCT